VSYLLYMITHDLSIHVVPYLIRPYNQTITNYQFLRVSVLRVDFQILDDTML